MNEIVLAAMSMQLDAQSTSINAMVTALTDLIAEIKRANDIHVKTLESLQAAMRDRGDEWWKGSGEG